MHMYRLRILRQGIHDLRVWPGKVADGDTGTPGKFSKESTNEMSKLAKVILQLHSFQGSPDIEIFAKLD